MKTERQLRADNRALRDEVEMLTDQAREVARLLAAAIESAGGVLKIPNATLEALSGGVTVVQSSAPDATLLRVIRLSGGAV